MAYRVASNSLPELDRRYGVANNSDKPPSNIALEVEFGRQEPFHGKAVEAPGSLNEIVVVQLPEGAAGDNNIEQAWGSGCEYAKWDDEEALPTANEPQLKACRSAMLAIPAVWDNEVKNGL